jgi:hypothetical protein
MVLGALPAELQEPDDGMPFEGIGTVGYDIFRQRYSPPDGQHGLRTMTSTGNASPTGEISMTGDTADDWREGQRSARSS